MKSKYYNNSNKLVFGKMKNETRGVSIEKFADLKPQMSLFLIDNNEHKKAKGMNKNVVATIIYNEYKDALLNKKCVRSSMNRIQRKHLKIGTYELNKI